MLALDYVDLAILDGRDFSEGFVIQEALAKVSGAELGEVGE